MIPAPVHKPTLTLYAPTLPGTSTADFVYFFPFWADRIPLCTTSDDLMDVLDPFMAHILNTVCEIGEITYYVDGASASSSSSAETLPLTGCQLEINPAMKESVGVPDSDHLICKFWHKVLRLYFLPAFPLICGDAVCTVKIWNVIRQFETMVLWKLYGEWKAWTYTTHPELRVRAV